MKKNMKIMAAMTVACVAIAANAQSLNNVLVTGEIVNQFENSFWVDLPTAEVTGGIEFEILFTAARTPVFEVDISMVPSAVPVPMSVSSVFGSPFHVGAGTGALVLGDLNPLEPGGPWVIGGIINFQTNLGPGISIGDVTFTDNEVRFDMSDNTWEADSFASWEVVFVPAPSSLALLALGGVAAMPRRRQ